MKLLSKISVKNVCGDVKDSRGDIMRVIGLARDAEQGESTYGTWQKLRGEFKAINLSTGEEFVSGACFLPEIATNLILPKLCDGDTQAVEFGFMIGVKDSDNVLGYEYTVTPLIDMAGSNPLMTLEEKINSKALGAPKSK